MLGLSGAEPSTRVLGMSRDVLGLSFGPFLIKGFKKDFIKGLKLKGMFTAGSVLSRAKIGITKGCLVKGLRSLASGSSTTSVWERCHSCKVL